MLGPQDEAFLETASSPGEYALETLVQRGFQSAYRVKEIRWEIVVTDEGNATNTYCLNGVFFRRRQPLYEMALPKTEIVGGKSLPYQLKSPASDAKLDSSSLFFRTQPTENAPAHAVVSNLDLNTYSMNRGEAADKGLIDPHCDSLEYLLSDPVDSFIIDLTFPESFAFHDFTLDVLEAGNNIKDTLNEPLSRLYQHCLQRPSADRLRLTLDGPVPHFRYKLNWSLPEGAATASARDHARQAIFESNTLQPAAARELRHALDLAVEILKDEVARLTGSQPDCLNKLDASLMVCDRSGSLPLLRIVAANDSVLKRDFTLPVGLGNAGSAYKKASVIFSDREEARLHPETDTYQESSSSGRTDFHISVPVLNLECLDLPPLAMLNFGAPDPVGAALLRCLVNKSAVQSLQARLLGKPLDVLYKAAKLEREVSTNGDPMDE